MQKRICLISPGHMSFNPRLVKEADALAEAGYLVHVIAANNLRYLRELDRSILTQASWSYDLVGGWGPGDKARGAATRIAKKFIGLGLRGRTSEYAHHALAAQ